MTGFTTGGSGGATLGGRVVSGTLQFAEGGTLGGSVETVSPRDYSLLVGRTRADFTEPPVSTFTPGDTVTVPLNFRPGESGGLPNVADRYNQIRDRVESTGGGSVTTGTSEDGTPYFRENHGDETLLVRVEPGRDMRDTRGVWAVVVGGEDLSSTPGTWRRYAVDVYVLAQLNEYDTAAAVREVHER